MILHDRIVKSVKFQINDNLVEFIKFNKFLLQISEGEFHFLPLEDKIHKFAPKNWKSGTSEVFSRLLHYICF